MNWNVRIIHSAINRTLIIYLKNKKTRLKIIFKNFLHMEFFLSIVFMVTHKSNVIKFVCSDETLKLSDTKVVQTPHRYGFVLSVVLMVTRKWNVNNFVCSDETQKMSDTKLIQTRNKWNRINLNYFLSTIVTVSKYWCKITIVTDFDRIIYHLVSKLLVYIFDEIDIWYYIKNR